MADLYEAIGAKRGASDAEVKRAYRKAAKKGHPDSSGSSEEFKLVGYAGMILCDPEKREHYDRTGEEMGPKNEVERRIASMLAQAFEQDKVDPIRVMCDFVDSERAQKRGMIGKFGRTKKKMSIKLKKFAEANKASRNVEARDFIVSNLENHLGDLDRAINAANSEIEICDAVLTYLNDLRCPPSETNSRGSPFDVFVFNMGPGRA